MYLESDMFVSQQATCKLIVQRLGMEIVGISPHLGVTIKKLFQQIKVGLLGTAVHHNSERESTAKMALMMRFGHFKPLESARGPG